MASFSLSNVVQQVDVVKKVLYISYDGLTDPLGQSQVLPYLMVLEKRGFEFTIVSFEKQARYQKEHAIIERLIEGKNIRWVPLTFTARPPVLSKIWDRYRMQLTAAKLHKKNSYQLIHCRSYVAGEVGLRLKQRTGVKFLFDMRGFWADEKVENGQWNLKSPVFKFIYRSYKRKEQQMLRQADGIITLTEKSSEYLKHHYPFCTNKIDVIPCCADLQLFNYDNVSASEKSALRQELNIDEETKVLVYLGSVGGWYMTTEMFQFFKQLQQSTTTSYKLLVLSKEDPQQIRSMALENGVSADSIIVTYAQRHRLPLYLSLCTAGIFFIRNTFSKIASSPTKHAELMGMGIPVVCNDIGDTGDIVQRTGTGLVINEFDETAFSKAIQQFHQLESIAKMDIRKAALKIFDLQHGVDVYSAVYKRLTS